MVFYPVLFLLVVLTVWILIYGGSFFAEWLERVRLFKYQPEDLPNSITSGMYSFLNLSEKLYSFSVAKVLV